LRQRGRALTWLSWPQSGKERKRQTVNIVNGTTVVPELGSVAVNEMAALGGDGLGSRSKDSLYEFTTYEDYLDSQVKERDLQYLEDEQLARQLVELGYLGTGEALKREEFESRKRELEEAANKEKHKAPKRLASAGIDFKGKPFLQALADREESIRNGKLTSILFIRDKNKAGQEISGYIDLAHRMKTEDFGPYFTSHKRLLPRPSDLSYYNWETQTCTSNPTPNFQVKAENETGLKFKNKRDRKVINVDPNAPSGDNSQRTEIETSEYIQVVIYDHQTRRKS